MPFSLFAVMGLTMILLFGFLFGVLAAVGYYVGLSGYLIVALAAALVAFQWAIGPKIIWWTTNMQKVSKKDQPWLFITVEEICKKTKTPLPKEIAIVNSGAPNAFVFGRTPSSATFAITRGLLNSLNKDEVKAVIAHEMGHINHKDMVVMTLASAIPTIAYFAARFLVFTPSKDEKKSGAAVLIGIAAFAIYFVTNLLVLALSRYREYFADKFSGKNHNPIKLASALAKITYGLSKSGDKSSTSVRSLYIADPVTAAAEVSRFSSEYSDLQITDSELKKVMEWEKHNVFARISEFFSTHPLTWKRLKALSELEKELSLKRAK